MTGSVARGLVKRRSPQPDLLQINPPPSCCGSASQPCHPSSYTYFHPVLSVPPSRRVVQRARPRHLTIRPLSLLGPDLIPSIPLLPVCPLRFPRRSRTTTAHRQGLLDDRSARGRRPTAGDRRPDHSSTRPTRRRADPAGSSSRRRLHPSASRLHRLVDIPLVRPPHRRPRPSLPLPSRHPSPCTSSPPTHPIIPFPPQHLPHPPTSTRTPARCRVTGASHEPATPRRKRQPSASLPRQKTPRISSSWEFKAALAAHHPAPPHPTSHNPVDHPPALQSALFVARPPTSTAAETADRPPSAAPPRPTPASTTDTAPDHDRV